MAEFIDILSPSALKDLREANVEVLELIKNIDKTGVAMKAVKTPSGSNDAIKKTTESYNQLEKQFVKINKLTSEEIVNQRALAQASDRQAKAVSLLVGAYQNLNAKHQQAKKSLQDLIVSGRRADETQAKYNTRLKEAQREFNLLDTQIKKADKAVGVFNRNVGNYPTKAIGGLKDLLGAFGVVGGATGIAMIAKDIYETTKQLQSLNMALLQVSESQEKMASTQAFLTRISEAYGVEIMGLTKQFTQFYVSAKDKISGQEIEDIFESVTKASASMGLTQEQTERAFLALNQMMSKGTVSAEELRGQLGEALPGAFGIMAKAMGVTEKQLGKMMKDGDVLASDVLPKFARQLEITYGIENVKRIDNIVNAQARLSNSWTALVATFSEGEGVLSFTFKMVMNNASFMLDTLNLLLKSSKQLRADELNDIASKEEKKTVIAVQEMQKRGKSEVETQQYITEQLAIESKKRRDLIIETNKLQEDVDKYENFLNRKDIIAQIKANNELIAKKNGIIEGLKKLKNPDATATDKEEENDKDRLKREDERLRQIFENRKKELEYELQIIDISLNNEDNLYSKRIADLELHRLKRFELLTLQYNEEMRLSKDNQLKQEEALLNYHKNSLNDIQDYNKKIIEIEKARLKPVGVTNLSDPQKDLADSASKATKELKAQAEATKHNEEAMRELKEITDAYLQTFQEGFFADAGLPTLFKVLNDEIIGFGQNFAVTFNTIAEIAQEAFAFISQASNRNFEVERENLQKKYDNAILFANGEAGAIAEINRQKEAKERDIRRRQAKAEKTQALFNIGVNTAQAIVATLARTPLPAGLPLVIATGLIGAAQLAVVASQQIPQYFRGTDNHKGGLMQINDGGGSNFKEIVQTPDGKMRMYNERDKILNAPKGTKVFTAQKSMDMLSFDNNLNNILLNSGIGNAPKIEVNNQGMSDAQVDRIVSTIQNKTEYIPTFNQNGFNMYVRNGHSLKEIKNKRVNFDGNKVG
jgi:tape measure domain-containing protein